MPLAYILWVGDERPSHPIAPGGPTPPVDPGWGVPGPPYPTHPIAPGGGHPEHPIVTPPLPPSIWPGPGKPTHPIVIPPGGSIPPDVGIWPDPGPLPHPENPIVLPPDKCAVVVYIPGVGVKAIVMPYPPPSYNPPAGGLYEGGG